MAINSTSPGMDPLKILRGEEPGADEQLSENNKTEYYNGGFDAQTPTMGSAQVADKLDLLGNIFVDNTDGREGPSGGPEAQVFAANGDAFKAGQTAGRHNLHEHGGGSLAQTNNFASVEDAGGSGPASEEDRREYRNTANTMAMIMVSNGVARSMAEINATFQQISLQTAAHGLVMQQAIAASNEATQIVGRYEADLNSEIPEIASQAMSQISTALKNEESINKQATRSEIAVTDAVQAGLTSLHTNPETGEVNAYAVDLDMAEISRITQLDGANAQADAIANASPTVQAAFEQGAIPQMSDGTYFKIDHQCTVPEAIQALSAENRAQVEAHQFNEFLKNGQESTPAPTDQGLPGPEVFVMDTDPKESTPTTPENNPQIDMAGIRDPLQQQQLDPAMVGAGG